MTRNELLKRLKRYARRNGLRLEVTNDGKGSHQRVHLGNRTSHLQYGEIPPRTLHDILRQLGLRRKDLN